VGCFANVTFKFIPFWYNASDGVEFDPKAKI
jgi:hypothetical protein